MEKKDTNNVNKRSLSMAIIGHVDHGKTTFTSAVTEVQSLRNSNTKKFSYGDIDTTPEEKSRKITINVSHIPIETDDKIISLVDCPGHEDYMKNMMVNSSSLKVGGGGAILLVSSRKGKEEQTMQHLSVIHSLGVENLMVFINDFSSDKYENESDREELRDLITADIETILIGNGYNPNNIKWFFASAFKAIGEVEKIRKEVKEKSLDVNALMDSDDYPNVKEIKNLIDSIDSLELPEISNRSFESFRMYVGESYTITGRGTVVSGRIIRGLLPNGSKVDVFSLSSQNIYNNIDVKGIETYHKACNEASEGDNVGVLLKGQGNIKAEEICRGSVLAFPGTLKIYESFMARAYINSIKERGRKNPFGNGFKPQFYIHTADITGEIILPEGELVSPGSVDVKFRVNLIKKFPLEKGDSFIIKESSTIVGSGFIESIIEE